MAVLFLFSDYLKGPFETTFWPFMGFVLLPATTLGYAASWHIGHGNHDTWGVGLIALGLLYDLGIVRSGRRRMRGDPPGGGGARTKEIVIEAQKVE